MAELELLIRDSYTGLHWCRRGLHLLTPENTSKAAHNADCLSCERINRRRTRAGQPPLPLPLGTSILARQL